MTKKEKARDSRLRKKYGITSDEYELMWKAQGECCYLCFNTPKQGQKKYAIDHDHATGRNRKILCYFCNKYRVGRLDLKWAYKIYNYLRENT